ncbi:MAG: hypothetical protein HY908_08405 [Myxococcales bacterium]|nr:hypothetical protein [Myxococcales bacterium]
MAKLELVTDAYGSRGQLSLIGDFVELYCTVSGRELGYKDVADHLHDCDMRIPRHQRVALEPDAADALGVEELVDAEVPRDHIAAQDARRQHANEDASRVFGLFLERARYLGDAYPFALEPRGLLHRICGDVVAYDVALSLALRHGCGRDQAAAIEFEGFVERCLRARHYRVFPLGERVRAAPSKGAKRFRVVYEALRRELDVRAGGDASISAHIHDGGVDVLARAEPVDDRPGCRTLLVQATVGKAETWHDKAHRVPGRAWCRILGDPIPPLVTLAVPHHVERDHLYELVDEGHGATVFDRLRLVAHGPRITKSERDSVRKLRGAGVEW